ncbi:hypothetical protein SCATT_39530 [Streptantibioticus cattleyicolor NRRL 8057 = DSM 46488]|uniref:Uncharacterized protein n=1 Tax=Streptantibioticus cattleyicolor (strain ATCC 35852 / DSM 46488 / JCM 4925 / NBRC 14057 / NRRL 8057) TaxID=1003195 RepID=G8WUN1_STREN|nr:hypothetical protein SCATT_39530 [Streptantibioticus cattleyicolor NRRL 8057 = DSM 46488]
MVGGLPPHVVAAVEHAASQLTELGRDAHEVGTGGRLRVVPVDAGAMVWFLPVETQRLIVIVRVVWAG